MTGGIHEEEDDNALVGEDGEDGKDCGTQGDWQQGLGLTA